MIATLGAGGGEFRATHSGGVQGGFSVTNDPASRSTVGVTATLGEVGESFTVRARSVTQFVSANFSRIEGNLSVTGGGSQFTNFSVTGGNVVGSVTATTNQSMAPNPAPNQSIVSVTASTVGGGVAVTNTGPEVVTTTVGVSSVGQDLRVTARGPDGATTVSTGGVARNAVVAVAGPDADVSLGNLTGSAQITVDNSDATVRDSSVGGNLTLTATGDTTNLTVQNVTVTGNLTSRRRARTSSTPSPGGASPGWRPSRGATSRPVRSGCNSMTCRWVP